MYKPEIFITLDAFNKFIINHQAYKNNDDDDKLQISLKWKDALLKRTKLHFNINIKDSPIKAELENNVLLKVIFKNSIQGYNNLSDTDTDEYENWDNDLKNSGWIEENPQALFILNNSEFYCEDLEEDFGQIVLNPERMITYGDRLFRPTHVPVKKGDSSEIIYNTINSFILPCNSILIADGYILDKDKEFASVLELLDSIMPKQLNKTCFQIHIISFDEKGNIDLTSKKYTELVNAISNLRKYEIELKISLTRKDQFHDRHVYSNYQWYKSGHSMTYIEGKATTFYDEMTNKKITKDTSVEITPILVEENVAKGHSSFNTKTDKLKSFQNIVLEHLVLDNKESPIKSYGITDSRLFFCR